MVIIIVLIVGLVLRLINLNQSLWLDEAVQALTAKNGFAYIFQEIIGDFHPPLYHFLMYFWTKIFGYSEISLRMPSVLFGIATIWMVFLISKRLKAGKYFPFAVSAFMATAPFHIYYSQEARMYSMATFLVSGSMYFFLKVISYQLSVTSYQSAVTGGMKLITNHQSLIAKYFLFTLLALYTDYYAFLVLLAQAIVILCQKKFKFFILYSLFFILYLPWLPMLYKQLQFGVQATNILPEWGRLVNLSFVKALPLTLVKFSIGRITIFNKFVYVGVTGVIGIIYGCLIFKGVGGWVKDGLKDVKSMIIAWFFVPVVIAWLVSLFVPNYQPFRLLLVLPAFYLMLSFGIFLLKNKTWRVLAVCFVLLVNFIPLFVYYTNPFFHREDWRGGVGYLEKQKSLAMLPSDTSSWPVRYYDPGSKINLLYGGKGISRINELSVNKLTDSKIYYIRYLVPLFDSNEFILAKLSKEGYTKIKEISFNQIPVWEFEMVTSD